MQTFLISDGRKVVICKTSNNLNLISGKVYSFEIKKITRNFLSSDLILPIVFYIKNRHFSNQQIPNLLDNSILENFSIMQFHDKLSKIPLDFYIEIEIISTTLNQGQVNLQKIFLDCIEKKSSTRCLFITCTQDLIQFFNNTENQFLKIKKMKNGGFNNHHTHCTNNNDEDVRLLAEFKGKILRIYNPIVAFNARIEISMSQLSFIELQVENEALSMKAFPKCTIQDIQCISKILKYKQFKDITIDAILISPINTFHNVVLHCEECQSSQDYNGDSHCSNCGAISCLYFNCHVALSDSTGTIAGHVSDDIVEKMYNCPPLEFAKKSNNEILIEKRALLFKSYTCHLKVTKYKTSIIALF